MGPVTIALAGIMALLVLLPTRRLQLAGWSRQALTTYFVAVWLLGVVVAALPTPARFLLPFLLVAYLAPFVTLREGLDRLRGRRPPPPRVDDRTSGAAPHRPVKDVTPPGERMP